MAVYTDDNFRLNSNCQPESGYAQLLKNWKWRRFWNQQLIKVEDQIRSESTDIQMLREMLQGLALGRRETQQLVAPIYEKSPELRPTAAGAYAQMLREKADTIEQYDRISSLAIAANRRLRTSMECKTIIQTHLAASQ